MKYSQFINFINITELENIKFLVDDYFSTNGISDWKDYFISIFQLINASKETGIVTFDDSKKSNYYKKILSRFFFNNSNNEIYEINDFVLLRKYPLIEIEENNILLFHAPFFQDKIFKSIFFELKDYSDKKFSHLKLDFKRIYELHFGDHFLLVNAIKLLFKNKYIQINNKAISNDSLAFPDYYVRNGSKIYLFENKYIKLSDKTKLSYDFEKFKEEVKQKLFITKQGKKKGVLQLLNCIKNSKFGKYDEYDKIGNIKLRYYPIIVVEDHTLCNFGINSLLNIWMREYIIANKNEFDNLIIKDLTIINIDDLLYYNNSLSKLDTILDSYHKFRKGKNQNAGISFSDYLDLFKFHENYSVNKKDVNHIFTEPFQFYSN